jgi:hypothetical protein
MSEGYLYCFSNEYMPGILKIGYTKRSPIERLKEANSFSWGLPFFKLVIAKKVNDYKQKEKYLHKILTNNNTRICNQREFFRISCEEIIDYFNLMDGVDDVEEIKTNDENIEEIKTNNENIEEIKTNYENIEEIKTNDDNFDENITDTDSNTDTKKCRDATKCFINGQRVMHKTNGHEWIGIYNSNNNSIIHNEIEYKGRSPLNCFVKAHYITMRPDRTPRANAWNECMYEVNGVWYSTNDIIAN